MSVSERIFSSENRTDFKNSLEISHNTHLFIKLRRLGKTRIFSEIFKIENITTPFRRSFNNDLYNKNQQSF
jgi:hypothetical protein